MFLPPPHFRVLFAGVFALILTLGVARFAYTPMLHVMQAQAGVSDAVGGWLATFNYAGYMSGALIAASISDLKLKDTLYRIGLLLAVLTTLGMGLTDNWVIWSVLRFVAGFSSAAGLLIASGLILNWLIRHGYRMELGVHFSGPGLGIALSAVAVAWMGGQLEWRQQWIVFSIIGAVLAVPAWFWLPRPDTSGLNHAGEQMTDNPPDKSWMRLLSLAYFCAGVGYVISATFIVVIVENLPALGGRGDLAWLLVGLSAAPASFLWDRIARRLGELNALMLAYVIQSIGIVLPAIFSGFWPVMFSAVLYGGTFIGIVSLMLTMVGKMYPTKPAKPMGKLTLGYGVAQVAAPAVAGVLAERSGHYNASLFAAALVMLVGVVLLFMLSRLPHRRADLL